MSASTDLPPRGGRRRRRMRVLFVLVLASALSGAAVKPDEDDGAIASANAMPPAPPRVAVAATPGRYVMRCWQYGRLLFEEALSQLPADAEHNVIRLQGADRAHSLYHLVDTRTAVCLVKPALDRSGWPIVNLPGRG